MDRIDSAIKINFGLCFFCIYSTPDKNSLDLYSGRWITRWFSSFQWQVLCERDKTGLIHCHRYFYTRVITLVHSHLIYKDLSQDIFNMIQKKKNTSFITVSNHSCTKNFDRSKELMCIDRRKWTRLEAAVLTIMQNALHWNELSDSSKEKW